MFSVCWKLIELDGIEIHPNRQDKDILDGSFWHVIEKGEATERYELKVNDVIRLGRVAFKINQVYTSLENLLLDKKLFVDQSY